MEQMRSDFEAWMSDNGKYPRVLSRNGDGYVFATAQNNWVAWQASRASIDISIGPDINPLMFNDDVLFGYQKGKDEVTDAIRAAGLRVKEK